MFDLSGLNVNMPILDDRVYDMQRQPLSEETLENVYSHTLHRLKSAGFQGEYDIKLISRYPVNFPSFDSIEYCTDKFCPSGIMFLLVFSADGIPLITPPYNRDTYELMSWHEYLFRTYIKEQLQMLIRAPWAQAKFINVGME